MNGSTKLSGCPYCGENMHPVALRCAHCDVEIRGRFQHSMLHSLSTDDLAFLEQYLLAEFNIKTLTESSGLGYTAIRSRLDRIIATFRRLANHEDEKRAILERLERGEISADAAAQAIEALK